MNDRQILAALLESQVQREAVALVLAVQGDGPYADQVGRHLLVWADAQRLPQGTLAPGAFAEELAADVRRALAARTSRTESYAAADGTLRVFIDVQSPPPHLIIVGAGHIAAPLAAVARVCDFEVSVLDDRPQYANRSRFPDVDRVIAGPFTEELRRLRAGRKAFDANTYMVLVTRGHQYDVACLLEILDDPLAYIGMIGSRRRIRAVYELLEREQGIAPQKFDRIHAPIGLAIGAQTPAEIAVCIMAEIISVQRGLNLAEGVTSLSAPLLLRRQARRAEGS